MTVARLYQAGSFTSNFYVNGGKIFDKLTDDEKRMRLSSQSYLESYHYLMKSSHTKRIRSENVKIFLDSGAYTAWSQGKEINLNQYIDYCHENEDIIEMAAVLDVLVKDVRDIPKAVKQTYWNLQEMERQKVKNVIPAYHFLEPEEVLKFYADNYPYIALGGLVGKSTQQLLTWLDRMWVKHLIKADGTPKCKVHGFGITSLPAMQRYPWTSVDSSTWVQWSANGMLLLPWRGMQINISNRSSARKHKDMHLTTYSPQETKMFEAEIIQYGGDPERLANYYYSRWAFNYWAFPEYLRTHPSKSSFKTEFTGIMDYDYAI